MTREKQYFSIGLVLGILVAGLFLYHFAPRYNIVSEGGTLIKQDRWSGNSWRYADKQWKRIADIRRDWESIDQALRQALDIPNEELDRSKTMDLLRDKFPGLKEITNDELLERIKIVYSQVILGDLYLNKFLNMETTKHLKLGKPYSTPVKKKE